MSAQFAYIQPLNYDVRLWWEWPTTNLTSSVTPTSSDWVKPASKRIIISPMRLKCIYSLFIFFDVCFVLWSKTCRPGQEAPGGDPLIPLTYKKSADGFHSLCRERQIPATRCGSPRLPDHSPYLNLHNQSNKPQFYANEVCQSQCTNLIKLLNRKLWYNKNRDTSLPQMSSENDSDKLCKVKTFVTIYCAS